MYTDHTGFWRGALGAIIAGAIAVPAVAQDSPGTTVDASRGGITISSGVNSLTIGARVQFRWTLEDREQFDGDTAGSGLGRDDGPFSQFDIPRTRVNLSGGVFKPWMRYSFQFELGRTSSEGGSRIKDALLEIRPVGRPYRFTLGQFKVPFGLQQLTSSGRLEFVDRTITDAKFTPSRDLGIMVSGSIATRTVGYDLGIFNGAGESVRQNNEALLWAGRLYIDPWGPYALSETAVDAGDRALLHLGVAVRGGKQARGRTASGIVENADNQFAANVEFAYKRPRFFSTAEYFWMTDEQDNPIVQPAIDSRGYHALAGYMIVPRRVDVGIQWAEINGDTDLDDAEVTELRGVVGYYWQAHNLKLQADAGQIRYGHNFANLSSRARQGLPGLGPRLVSGQDLSDTQVRVQFQLGF